MAKNSKREQILVYHLNLMKVIGSINHTQRILPSYAQLGNFASTQFPVLAVVGRLPVPVVKKTGSSQSGRGLAISSLTIDNFVYLQDNENPDSKISEILDDIWVRGYSDRTYGGLIMEVDLTPEPEVVQWPPFLAFRVSHVVRYQHTIGGI